MSANRAVSNLSAQPSYINLDRVLVTALTITVKQMVNGKKLAVGTSNHGTRPESERSELSGEVGSVHPGVEPPDLVSDPRVLQAFGR